MISKFGKKSEDISKLFDHTVHDGSNYLNGHCFTSLVLCILIWSNRRVAYLAVPLGYRMRRRGRSKLELATAMVRQAMPSFAFQKNVIIFCDGWYTEKNPACIINEYPNLDLICNARADSVICDLAPQPTGRRGRPAKHGERLSIREGFTLSAAFCWGDRGLLHGCTPDPYQYLRAKEGSRLYDFYRENWRLQTPVFQYDFSETDVDILHMTRKGAVKPDRE